MKSTCFLHESQNPSVLRVIYYSLMVAWRGTIYPLVVETSAFFKLLLLNELKSDESHLKR